MTTKATSLDAEPQELENRPTGPKGAEEQNMQPPSSATQRDSDRPSPTTHWSAGQLAWLAGLKRRLNQDGKVVDTIEPVGGDGVEHWVAITLAVTAQPMGVRNAVLRAAITAGIEQGMVLLPLIYTPLERKARPGLDKQPALHRKGVARDLRLLFAEGDGLHPGRSVLRSNLLATTRSDVAFLRSSLAATLPQRHGVAQAAAIMRELFELLFAAHDRVFQGTAEDVRFFLEKLVASTPFARADLVSYLQLQAIHRQLEEDHLWTKGDRYVERNWREVYHHSCDVCRHFELWTIETFSSPRQLAARRIVRFVVRVAAVCVPVILLVIFCWPQEILEPVDDPGLNQKRGAIKGTYYAGRSLEKQVLERVDRTIGGNYGNGAPAAGMPHDEFSIRWQGYLLSLREGKQTYCVRGDNGFRLYLGEKLLIDDWRDVRPRTTCETIRLRKGWYPLKLEFFEGRGGAQIRLFSRELGSKERPVPSSRLCCKNGPIQD